jgi:hypothetical protein
MYYLTIISHYEMIKRFKNVLFNNNFRFTGFSGVIKFSGMIKISEKFKGAGMIKFGWLARAVPM